APRLRNKQSDLAAVAASTTPRPGSTTPLMLPQGVCRLAIWFRKYFRLTQFCHAMSRIVWSQPWPTILSTDEEPTTVIRDEPNLNSAINLGGCVSCNGSPYPPREGLTGAEVRRSGLRRRR